MLPTELSKRLSELQAENLRGVAAVFEAETALAEAEHELDLIENRAYIRAEGTVGDRTALAKLESADARLHRDIKRAELNRIRLKLKAIESAMMAIGTQTKLLGVESRL
jgi:Tfp pilus assembly protein PilX